MMLLRVAVAAALALVSLEVVSAQTGFCVGNDDADAEPDVACGTGYALKDGAAAVVRGGGNGHDSEAAVPPHPLQALTEQCTGPGRATIHAAPAAETACSDSRRFVAHAKLSAE